MAKPLNEIILGFTPAWFTATMGTGINGILIYTLPYQFRGCHEIGLILFTLNVFLFILFSIILISKYIFYSGTFRKMIEHPMQSMFVGAIPIGLDTIINSIIFMFPKNTHSWSPTLGLILWSVNIALTLFSCLVIPFYKMVIQEHSLDKMYATWILPIVPAVVVASSGSVVANVLPAHQAHVIIIISYILWGLGISLCLCVIGLYYTKITLYKLPPPELLITVFFPLGPLGQGSFGIMNLGIVANKIYGTSSTISIPTPLFGEIALVFGVLIGMVMWGFGFFWLSMATSSIIYGMQKNKVKFNLSWWGLTFPLGVYISATNTLGNIFDSTAFKVLGTFLTCCLFCLWLLVFCKTVRGAYTSELFVDPSLVNANAQIVPLSKQDLETQISQDLNEEISRVQNQTAQKDPTISKNTSTNTFSTDQATSNTPAARNSNNILNDFGLVKSKMFNKE
ncbi:hypothetical protein BB559_003960 [Furculomyces boomerangus]|uniref:Sulfite efflux pump SSU1 n=2 Tax=Harpellales TaxID=61421 RepID=A0A2T9YHH5_9FUNG|nr:hypothetical protein BB559_003960 [Furculomyces boomerangus]PVZ99043.1 hypothetical protein BB558_004946 [Smittium angustum]